MAPLRRGASTLRQTLWLEDYLGWPREDSMRALFLLLAFVIGLPLSAASAYAANFDDPKALVNAIYEPFTRHEKPADLQQFYSEKLKLLFAHKRGAESFSPAALKSGQKPKSIGDFNPFVNADNYFLADLNVGEPMVLGQNAMVQVSYHNFDHPSLLSLALVKGADGWKVDDVTSLGADQHWLLSWLLTHDPFEQ
jgi:hypothetical protein